MLVVAKTPHINLKVEGTIPKKLLEVLKVYFGTHLTVSKDDETVNIFESDWFKNHKKKMTPAKTLKIYRENKGWTLDELGCKLGGISRQYLSDIEHERRNISKEMAKKLSELFDVPVDRFI
ncbi:MAG: Cro/CI family transcriptional regulator [uncultured bacterium]|nr:MAG: Cro/CI family transcriptional regulator [uncultured bacterium]